MANGRTGGSFLAENGAWRDARGGADERNQGGTGNGDCSRTATHNGGARLSEVPSHHALLPLSGVQRKLTLLEHEAARWLLRSELDSVEWLPADEPVARMVAGMQKAVGNG